MASLPIVEPALASVSKVRIVRLLVTQPDRWFREADISREIRMSPNTVNLALRDLEKTGLVTTAVGGSSRQVRLNAASLLAKPLRALFRVDEAALAALQAVVRPLVDRDETCILFGSAARGEMARDSDIDLLFVAKTLDRAAELDVQFTRAARRVFQGRYRALHMTRSDVRARWNTELVQNLRREGHLLGGRPLEESP